jgi:hypothetical protein
MGQRSHYNHLTLKNHGNISFNHEEWKSDKIYVLGSKHKTWLMVVHPMNNGNPWPGQPWL